MSPRLHFAAATDIGHHRHENQDLWLIRDDQQLAAVADGMGGLPCGAEAAQCAIDSLETQLARSIPSNLEGWRALLDSLNRDVFTLGLKLSPKLGMGTTFTVVRAQTGRLEIAHVGDSAVFRLREGTLKQLTREHTVAAEVLEHRAAGLVERMPHAAEHMLTSCLGLPYLPQKDVIETDLVPGDRLLLCSDGLTKPVEFSAICETLSRPESSSAIATELIALANRAGGPDNITAIVGFCSPDCAATQQAASVVREPGSADLHRN